MRIIDGHQRRTALLSLKADGYTIPPLPVDYIYAQTEEEARRILLSVSSQYGEWVEDELKAWLDQFDNDLRETLRIVEDELNILKIPEIDNSSMTDTRTGRSAEPSKSKMVISIGRMSDLVDYEKVELIELKISKKFEGISEFAEWLLNTL